MRSRHLPALFGTTALFASVLYGHNPCCKVTSIGVPNASISLNGTAEANEWNGAGAPVNVGGLAPLNGTITLLHKADGIYFLAVINDTTNNDNDAFNIRFDINHNGGGAPDADDFGVVVLRNGQASWGPANANPNTWGAVPASNVGVTTAANTWIVEFHLPTGPPSNLTLDLGTIGVYFNFYDADQAFGTNSAKYSQFPAPGMGDDPNALFDQDPDKWADLTFDPKTTFPDVQVITEHRSDAGVANYYNLNYQGTNSFEIEVKNAGGTVIGDANNVRLNLYLAARGIGESWHRLDTNAVLTADCGLATWPSSVVPQTAVCSGAAPLPDISTTSLNDVVANTAKYTIQNGIVMQRKGGNPALIPAATDTTYPVIDWNTTAQQDGFFEQVTVNGTKYDRAHECMLAEAISPNDPNPGNNTAQVNMNFQGIPATNFIRSNFSLGWPGFAKYDPNTGRAMFLQVSTRNMDERIQFELAGVKPIQKNSYVAELKGRNSLGITAGIKAASPDIFGKTIKENLMVPPNAGGTVLEPKSGGPPVTVSVPENSTLWIVNYSLNDKDSQYVDVDGKGPLPPTGPAGLSPARVPPSTRRLLVPGARLGELVLSFDGFKTGIGIAEGAQIRIPDDVHAIALAINNYAGAYRLATGTGFRVKITLRGAQERPPDLPASEIVRIAMGGPAARGYADARAVAPPPVAGPPVVEGRRYVALPIIDVIPQICVAGYEDAGQKRPITGTDHELYRYIGNVCWGITNIVREQAPPPDKPDRVPR